MRLGSDSGRNFLSTEDPVRKDNRRLQAEVAVEKEGDSRVQRFDGLQRLLRQLYPGGGSSR